jgi:signal transduction histidine kinase
MPQPQTDDEVAELARTLDQMLRALDEAQTEREQVMHKQREFVADASHELRTPLTSVIANLELLQESLGGSTGVDQGEAVSSALRSSRRMNRLVGDLLLLARADAGRLSERFPCDLAQIVEAAVAEVAPLADDHELSIAEADSIPLYGNPDELHRMVSNLLDNAIRHTPAGTRVELRTLREDDHGTLEVSDDGPGIPASLREHVFDRFVRGSGPADIAAGTGTGLGLAIVRAVARAHGGEVAAGSSSRGGALFRVSLPKAKTEEGITAPLSRL